MLSIEAKTTGPIRKKNLPLIPYGVEGDWLGLEGVRGGGRGGGRDAVEVGSNEPLKTAKRRCRAKRDS